MIIKSRFILTVILSSLVGVFSFTALPSTVRADVQFSNAISPSDIVMLEKAIADNASALDSAMASRMARLEQKIASLIIESGKYRENSQGNKCSFYIDQVPYEANNPGTYCMIRNLDAKNLSTSAVTINSDNVVINGNGYCIVGPETPDTHLYGVLSIDRSHIEINNICITGFHTSVLIGGRREPYWHLKQQIGDGVPPEWGLYKNEYTPGVNNIVVRNLYIARPSFQGIHIRGDSVTVSENSVNHVGGTRVIPDAFASGIQVNANNCKINKNHIFGMYPTGIGEGVGISLYMGQGCIVSDNVITGTPKKDGTSRLFGTWIRSAN